MGRSPERPMVNLLSHSRAKPQSSGLDVACFVEQARRLVLLCDVLSLQSLMSLNRQFDKSFRYLTIAIKTTIAGTYCPKPNAPSHRRDFDPAA